MNEKRTWESPELLSKQVGLTLRRIRKEREISLQELTELTEVSKLTLGKIERGEANPSLTIIWRIANGLNIPISSLLVERRAVQISRSNEGTKVLSADESLALEPMFADSGYASLETHRAFLKPESEYRAGAHQSGVVEYVTVMEGHVKIKVDNEVYRLNEYDSIQFNADQEHCYINEENVPAVLHFVMIYATS
ncbi:helix-turn-helix domain-containing protein [Jeotgalibacillus proteolyticus]|uniref:Transcriptional regulator n=1 Tax=Jeotgalibacillus proteolyticus TaxID=2082395 RepID=A0A2S5GEY8_9BACL|nr:XRE family transcriptional regulator [Jeotgalibacillus proteolyticus]PPA71607.1 transcriptional regulator [Jeotgalibacillus proteolyticus]